MPVSQQTLDQIALSRGEYDLIVQKLEREPNELELGLFGALWSEHCGYKHSKPLLKGFPTTGPAVQVQAGEENAGVVDIGDGLSVVFKIESHNHPSAVEPYQGAATGVGGIVRDILAMGARPIALLNSLRFGPLDDPRNRYLFQGVVAGISGYGNCIGVPDVGGEVVFAPSYNGNPLVNAMCVGLLPAGGLMRAAATNPGAVLMVVGSATGRDGIHGASGLASRTFEEEREMRPTVQVGDPFLEKVLIEACLEAAVSGHLDGMQDMGAAGLTSSVMECAARGGTGVAIDVAKAPRREEGMTPYEVMLSESQERMLLIVKPGREDAVAALCERWDLAVTTIGVVTGDGLARIYDGEALVAEARIDTLIEAPQYRPLGARPAYLDRLQSAPMPDAPELVGGWPHPAHPPRGPEHRQQARGVPPLRPRSADADRRQAWRRRCGRPAPARDSQGAGAGGGRQRQARLPGPLHGRRDGRRGGVPQRRRRRGRSPRGHRLPQFREPGEARGLLPARRVHPWNVGRVQSAREFPLSAETCRSTMRPKARPSTQRRWWALSA